MSHKQRSRIALRVAVATTVGLVLGMLGQALPANAAAPSEPSGVVVEWVDAATPILSWSPSSGAARYNVEIADNVGFTNPLVKDNTANTRYVPTAKLKPGNLYWHVQAVSSSGEQSGWTFAELAVSPVATPVPSSPVDDAQLQMPNDAPLLTWTMPSGAAAAGTAGIDSYRVDVSRDNFTTFKTFTTKSTALVVPDPLSLGTWKWRVTAVKSASPLITSLASEPRSFTIVALATPEITGPTQTAVTDVVLDWDHVPGAAKYELQVSKTSDFSGALVDSRMTATSNPVFGTKYSPPITYDNNNTYYWQVRAVDSAGNSSEWAKAATPFKRHYPYAPTLAYPQMGAVDVPDPLYFDWTPVKHASRYEFQISTDDAFTPAVTSSCIVAGTTYTPGVFRYKDTQPVAKLIGQNEDCEPAEGVTNYWRVRALDRPFKDFSDPIDGVKGNDWSPHGSFKAGGMALTNITTSRAGLPTISWDPVVAADKYEIMLSGPTSKIATTRATSWTPDGTTKLTAGSYQLSLKAVSIKGVSSLIERRTFSVSATIPTTGAAALTLSTPVSGTTVTDVPLLAWEPDPDAAYYKVFVTDPDGTAVGGTDSLFEKPVPYPSMTDTSIRLLKKAGSYSWQVYSYKQDGTVNDVSGLGTFNVTKVQGVSGNELALTGRELDHTSAGTPTPCTPTSGPCVVPATPVFRWDPVPQASYYLLYLAEDANFTQLIEPTYVAATTNTMWTPTKDNLEWSLGDSEAAGTQTQPTSYYWFVMPCRSESVCADGPRSRDVAQHTFTKKSPAVTGQSTTQTEGTEVTFTWDDYWHDWQSSSPADRWEKTGETLPQSAMQYRIEVSRDPTYAGNMLVDRIDVDQTTYTAFTKTYAPGTYYWRVQAIDDFGNALTWSDADPDQEGRQDAAFTILPPKVTLTSPVDNVAVQGSTAFAWKAQPFAKGYDIAVYKNDDTTFSDGNRVAFQQFLNGQSGGVLTTAWTWSSVIPASTSAYLWRVRRVDASGNPGPWSEPGRFFVSSDGLEITSPLSGGSQPPDAPLLQWNQVPGASAYTVDIRPQTGGSGTTDSATAVGTAFASKKLFTTGTYLASVTARDASGNALSTGQVAFTVDSRVLALSSPVIGAPSGTGVGATLTSSPPTWNQIYVATTYQWLRDGQPISGATKDTYALTVADFGKSISLRATGKKTGFADGVAVSNAIGGTAGGAVVATTQPTITGTAKVGMILQVSSGTWSQPSPTFKYQWLRNGAPIPSATSVSYRLSPEDGGKNVSVTVLATKAGFADGSAAAAAVSIPKMTSTTTATLSATRVKPSKRVKVGITIMVPGVTGPVGQIKVLDRTKVLKKLTLVTAKNGKVTVRLPKLKRGKHRIRVKYLGDATTQGSRSKAMRLSVQP